MQPYSDEAYTDEASRDVELVEVFPADEDADDLYEDPLLIIPTATTADFEAVAEARNRDFIKKVSIIVVIAVLLAIVLRIALPVVAKIAIGGVPDNDD